MYTSCWLLYSEQIYSQPLQLSSVGLMNVPPSLPSLPLPLLQSATIANKFFPPYFHHMAASFQLWKHRGHPTLYQVIPNSLWPPSLQPRLPHLLRVLSVCAPPVLFWNRLISVKAGSALLGFHNSLSSRSCPCFTSAWSSPCPRGPGTSPSYKLLQHFLRNKPRGPQSWVVWVTYWITALKSILP